MSSHPVGECNQGERVRFSKGRKHPRRFTMFTVRQGKHIYFGISKLNVKHDKYDRTEGVKQAKSRAYAAANSSFSQLDSFISPDGFQGKYRVRDFMSMIERFNRLR